MQNAVLRGCDWEESQFNHCDLRETDFSHSRLTGVRFQNAILSNATFNEAILNETIIAPAEIEGFDVGVVQSHDNLVVSRDQHETILNSFSIRTQA